MATPILTDFDRGLLLSLRLGLPVTETAAFREATRYMVGLGLLMRVRVQGRPPLRVTDSGRRESVGFWREEAARGREVGGGSMSREQMDTPACECNGNTPATVRKS